MHEWRRFSNAFRVLSLTRTFRGQLRGLDSFEDIRRGFEFGPNRPMFYPPPSAMNVSGGRRGSGNSGWNSNDSWAAHKKFESIYSVALVYSFGSVLDSGTVDLFGYMQARPISDDMSRQYLQQELWCPPTKRLQYQYKFLRAWDASWSPLVLGLSS